MNIGALNHSTVITLGNPVNIFMLIIQSTYLQQTFSCRSACSCIVHYLSHICDRYENEAKFLSVTDMSQIVFYRYITDILQNWYVYMSHICQFGKGKHAKRKVALRMLETSMTKIILCFTKTLEFPRWLPFWFSIFSLRNINCQIMQWKISSVW